MLGHGQGLVRIPVAQHGALADNGQPVVTAKLRCTHHQARRRRERRLFQRLGPAPADAVGKGRTVEIRVLGDVVPAVEHRIVGAMNSCKFQRMAHGCPLMAHAPPAALNPVIVGKHPAASARRQRQLVSPAFAVGRHHAIFSLCISVDEVQNKFLAKACPIINIKF